MNTVEMKLLNKISKGEDTAKLIVNMMTLACAVAVASQAVLAQGDAGAATSGVAVIKGVLSVIYLITNVLGILFVMVGFVKLVIAHAQEDAPGQQKAAMFIATGLALILLRLILKTVGFDGWINTTSAFSEG